MTQDSANQSSVLFGPGFALRRLRHELHQTIWRPTFSRRDFATLSVFAATLVWAELLEISKGVLN